MTADPGRRRRQWALPLSAVLALLGASVLIWALTHQQGDPPAPPSALEGVAEGGGARPSTTPPPDDAETPPADDAEPTTAPPAAADSAGPEQVDEEPQPVGLDRAEPLSIRIPSIGVDSPLHALGLDEDGTLQVPSGDRFDEAAWYDGSPTPGEIGPSVIEGHVTNLSRGPSVFFDLGALRPGDLVEVDRQDGSTVTFEVYDLGSFPKDAFPRVAVYGNTDEAELRLITCGGVYDEQARHHVDNVVVFARMVEP